MKIISTRPCLRLRTNFGPRIAFWGLIWVIFWSLFWVPFLGVVLGPWILFVIVWTQNGAQKWNPKLGPKYDPIQDPKCNPGPQICTETQTRTCRDDLHSAVCWAIGFKCATNNFKQRRKGNLGGQNCSNREHEYIHRPNIVKTCFTCRRYTVKSHAWENQQHACYYGGTPKRHRKTACFETLVLEPHFAQSCGLFLLLIYCLLGWRTSLQRLKVLRMCWSSRGLPRLFLAPFNASSEK